MRFIIGRIAATLAIGIFIYMILGMIHLVPLLDYQLFNQSLLRLLAQVSVLLLLLAAWAFWET